MEKPLAVNRISKNFQVTIPVKVRETLNIEINDYIAFWEEKGEIKIRKVEFDR